MTQHFSPPGSCCSNGAIWAGELGVGVLAKLMAPPEHLSVAFDAYQTDL